MPTPAPLLTHARILCAAHRCESMLPCNTNVTADTLADFIKTPLLNLLGQERIGNRRPRRADHVQHAAPNLADHGIGRGEPTDPHYGFRSDLLDECDIAFLPTLLAKTRANRIILPIAEVDVPQVRELSQQLNDFSALTLTTDTLGSL